MDIIQLKFYINNIIDEISENNWQPDYIVGIGRGGLLPAVIMSYKLKIPMYTLDISLHDPLIDNNSNCWMAEDASFNQKNILVVDDFCNTGATIKWIKSDWQSSVNFDEWETVWKNNVRFATIINNKDSVDLVNYYGIISEKYDFSEIYAF